MTRHTDGSPQLLWTLLHAALREPESMARLPLPELDMTLRYARRARLLGRLAVLAAEAGVTARLPIAAVDQLAGARVVAEARLRSVRWELDRIERCLRQAGYDGPLVVLKGCAYGLAHLPNAPGRWISDLDLMVPELRLAEVERALVQGGWVGKELTPYDDQYYRRWAHELPPMAHPERDVEVDLHHNLLMRTARLKPQAALMLQVARPLANTRCAVLAPVDMVLHAMVHLFAGGEMDDALRELVDIDLMLRHFSASEPEFWEQFWPRAQALDLARPAYYGLRYASRMLQTPVPEKVLASSSAAAPPWAMRGLMDRLVPLALLPLHPDEPSRVAGAARWLLYLRSHWVKMPAGMLAQHLGTKLVARFRKRDH